MDASLTLIRLCATSVWMDFTRTHVPHNVVIVRIKRHVIKITGPVFQAANLTSSLLCVKIVLVDFMEIDVNQYVVIVRMENFVTQITDHVNLAVFPSFNPLFAKTAWLVSMEHTAMKHVRTAIQAHLAVIGSMDTVFSDVRMEGNLNALNL